MSSDSVGRHSKKDHQDTQGIHYMLCEARRDKAFQSFQTQSGQEFLKAEKAQVCAERGREEAFDRKITDFKVIFDANQQRRERLYLEADRHLEEIFQSNDNRREIAFQVGQTSRAAMYEKEEATRVQLVEWFRETRATILLEGRQAREKICSDADTAIGMECESLLRAQEDIFLQKERERDTVIQDILAAQTANLSSDDVLGSVAQGISSRPLPATTHVPPHAVSESVVLANPALAADEYPEVDLQSASESHPPLLRHFTPPTVVIPPIVLPQMSARQQKRDDIPELGKGFEVSQNDNPIPELQKGFEASQRRRSQDFAYEEELREERFEAAESERDRAESERSRLFDEQVSQWQDIFHDMLDMQEDHYSSKEENRADMAYRRTESFRIAQERHDQALSMSIYDIEKRIQIEDSLEEFLDKKLKHRVEATAEGQNDRLKAAADDQQTRFSTAQFRRQTQLGITSPSPILNQEPPMVLVSPSKTRAASTRRQSEISRYSYPGVSEGSADSSYGRPARHRRRRSESEYSYPVVSEDGRSATPLSPVRARVPITSGFDVNALFEGAGISDPLPIPKPSITIQREIEQVSSFETIPRYETLFKQSQSHREEVFQRGMERRHLAFSMNEQRRAFDFEKQQRSRQAAFEGSEDKRERSFNEEQREHEVSFWVAERRREASFLESERSRHNQFKMFQEDRGQKFYATLQELQTKLFVVEERRFENMKTWKSQLSKEFKKQGEDSFQVDEAERDKSFRSMLSASAHVPLLHF
ncbi:hypothetical protein C0992_012042 [Termitomyces sp. T32_za158]|nr:hypothetical protein C0992_012042 [Termitomyces sp. T32_za158]